MQCPKTYFFRLALTSTVFAAGAIATTKLHCAECNGGRDCANPVSRPRLQQASYEKLIYFFFRLALPMSNSTLPAVTPSARSQTNVRSFLTNNYRRQFNFRLQPRSPCEAYHWQNHAQRDFPSFPYSFDPPLLTRASLLPSYRSRTDLEAQRRERLEIRTYHLNIISTVAQVVGVLLAAVALYFVVR
jgi:hypothetical protein